VRSNEAGIVKEVLILGNGASRIFYRDFINKWEGEMWACNRAYRDFGQDLTRLTGHQKVLAEAEKFRDVNGWKYEIWGGHHGAILSENWHRFSAPVELLKDSGSTLVAQALEEKYDKILVCGFDFGGFDLYSPIEKQNKVNWVQRWRNIALRYGLDSVIFIGYDHKPYLLSGE